MRLVAAFCAVCTEVLPVGSVVRTAPLGKNAALVAVCADCDSGEIRSWCSDRSYSAPESKGSAIALIDAAYHRLAIPAVPNDECLSPRADAVLPGHVVCRVGRRSHSGKPRDATEALKVAQAKWGDAVSFVSTTARWHVFQMPGEQHEVDERDPLAEIRQWES